MAIISAPATGNNSKLPRSISWVMQRSPTELAAFSHFRYIHNVSFQHLIASRHTGTGTVLLFSMTLTKCRRIQSVSDLLSAETEALPVEWRISGRSPRVHSRRTATGTSTLAATLRCGVGAQIVREILAANGLNQKHHFTHQHRP